MGYKGESVYGYLQMVVDAKNQINRERNIGSRAKTQIIYSFLARFCGKPRMVLN